MIHFVRDSKNNTIIDCEALKDDLHCSIDIRFYTMFLLSLEKDKQLQFMGDVDAISEIRGAYFEDYNYCKKIPIDTFVKDILKYFAKKWGLYYVED